MLEDVTASLNAPARPPLVAYFSMEYGLHEEFPSYAGGLGVLAGRLHEVGGRPRPARGRHRAPLGAGLHRPAHRRRRLSRSTSGTITSPTSSPTPAPACACASRRARSSAASGAWAATRSRRSSCSSPPIRATCGSPGASTTRARTAAIAQEMLLGIGGVRALRALHLPVEPLPLQRGPRRLRGHRADRRPHGGRADLPRRRGRPRGERIVFTTHTPVPAGNEVHPLADLRRLGAGCELVPTRAGARSAATRST